MAESKVISTVDSEPDLHKNTHDATAVVVVEASPEDRAKTSLWRRVVGLVWDSVEGDPEYRKYVQRLDTFFLCVILPIHLSSRGHGKADGHRFQLSVRPFVSGISSSTLTRPITVIFYNSHHLKCLCSSNNTGNAFISGMQEDLGLYGNERNWLNTWFSLGIMVGSVPAQMSQLSFIRPSVLIPSCELIWSMLVVGMGFSKNIQTVSGLS